MRNKRNDVRYIILRKLKDNAASYISGQSLSESLGITRTAVWKHIKALMNEGYVIESSTRKGHRLVAAADNLNAYELEHGPGAGCIGKKIYLFESIDSTNNYAKKAALEGCDDGTVVIAEAQTSGRGRLGRAWDSAYKKGIWMSVVLKPSIDIRNAQVVSLAASVAVVNAIMDATGIQACIKWPNDIIIDGKKACGILTEMGMEMDCLNYIVLGIGMNVNQDVTDFPPHLRGVATSLKMFAEGCALKPDFPGTAKVFDRTRLVKSLLFELEKIYDKINKGFTREIICEWKRHSVTLGREVKFILKDVEYMGIASNVTDDGRLVVKCNDGVERELSSGEVQVRGMLGYI